MNDFDNELNVLAAIKNRSNYLASEYEKNLAKLKKDFIDSITNYKTTFTNSSNFIQQKNIEASIEKEHLLYNIDEKIQKVHNIYDNEVKNVLNRKEKRVLEFNRIIKVINEEYEKKMEENLEKTKIHVTKIQEKLNQYIEKEKPVLENRLKENDEKILTKENLVNNAEKHYATINKQNKEQFLSAAAKINSSINEIKKHYIALEENYKLENDDLLRDNDEKIKNINLQYIEDQKPFLIEFKNQFEKCDREALSVRKAQQNKENKLIQESKRRIDLLNEKIRSLKLEMRKQLRKNANEQSIIRKKYLLAIKNQNTLIKNERKETIKIINGIDTQANISISNLREKQKVAELTKNYEIMKLKCQTDYQIMILQATNNYYNAVLDLQIKTNKTNEQIEIAKYERELALEESLRDQRDQVSSSDSLSFRNDYHSKINLIKLTNKNLEDTYNIGHSIEKTRVKLETERYEVLSNLAIERDRLTKEYKTNIEKLNLENSMADYDRELNLLEAQLEHETKNFNIQKDLINLDFQIQLKNSNFDFAKKEYEFNYNNQEVRINYNYSIKNEKSDRIIKVAKMENQFSNIALNKLRKNLLSINQTLSSFVVSIFSTLDKKDIIENLKQVTEQKIVFTNNTFAVFDQTITNKIDELTSFRYNAFKTETIETAKERKDKIELTQQDVAEEYVLAKDNQSNLHYQLIYLQQDLAALVGKKNLLVGNIIDLKKHLTKENKKEYDEMIKDYQIEINNITKSMRSYSQEINQLKKITQKNEMRIDILKRKENQLKNDIVHLDEYTKDSLENLERKKHNEAKIYYVTLENLEHAKNMLLDAFKTTYQKLEKFYEVIIPNKENVSYEIVKKERYEMNKFCHETLVILDSLYRNINVEQIDAMLTNDKQLNTNLANIKKLFTRKCNNEDQRLKKSLSELNQNIREKKLEKQNEDIRFKKQRIKQISDCSTLQGNILQTKKNVALKQSFVNKALSDNVFHIKQYSSNCFKEFRTNQLRELTSLNNNLTKIKNITDFNVNLYSKNHENDLITISNRLKNKQIEIEKNDRKKQHYFKKTLSDISDMIKLLDKDFLASKEEINREMLQYLDEYENKFSIDQFKFKRFNRRKLHSDIRKAIKDNKLIYQEKKNNSLTE